MYILLLNNKKEFDDWLTNVSHCIENEIDWTNKPTNYPCVVSWVNMCDGNENPYLDHEFIYKEDFLKNAS